MADDSSTLVQVLTAVGSSASAAVGTVLAMARKNSVRLRRLEDRLTRLEEALAEVNLARTSHPHTGVAATLDEARRALGRARDVRIETKAAIDRLETELRAVRAIAERAENVADAAVCDDTFTEQVARDALRWQEVHRALGQIEGMLGVVRDRLQLRGPR